MLLQLIYSNFANNKGHNNATICYFVELAEGVLTAGAKEHQEKLGFLNLIFKTLDTMSF